MSAAPANADPYAAPPVWWRRNADYAAAAAVFVATVALTVLSFPPFHLPEFAYALLVPGIFWAYTGPRLKLFAGTLLGAQALAWTIILGWLHHVTWGGLFLLGPLVGAWVGLWFLAAWWAMPRLVGRAAALRLAGMLALAGAWVALEWTRTVFLGGFPWLPLAASQWERSSILQVAAFTGAGGVSFVLVAANLGFAAMAHSLFVQRETGWNLRRPEFLLALFLLMACVSVHMQETFNRGRFTVPLARVAFVQPYVPQSVKWDPAAGPAILKMLEDTTLAAAGTAPDLILWPEAVTPWAVKGDANVQAFVESLARRAHAPLLLGSIAIENSGRPDEQWFNAAFAVQPDTGVQPAYYRKRHLVPFGEFVPVRPLLGWLNKFVPIGEDFARGADSAPLTVALGRRTLTFGPLICYEDIYPLLGRASALAGADALVVLTNNGWFGEGGAAYQHAAHSVLRAVETRRPVLRCGNGGWSGWIDEFGNVRVVVTNAADSVYFRGAKRADVTRDARWIGRNSFYVEHGDWFLLVSLGLGALGAALLAPPRRDA